jgi:type IV pilus assembly protein PilC
MATKKVDAILTFGYEATDRKGQKIKGEITGTNIALAKTQLRKQGLTFKK